MTNLWADDTIRLRAVEPADWTVHFEWNQDSEMSRALDYLWLPTSREAVRQWAEAESRRTPQHDCFTFEIETLADAHVGIINTHHCNPRTGTFAYGIAIRRTFRRRGYATRAIRLVLNYYFNELRYQKVNAGVYSFNEGSCRLHEALGFALEGRIRRMVYTGGAFYDELVYGMTAEEFATGFPPLPAAPSAEEA